MNFKIWFVVAMALLAAACGRDGSRDGVEIDNEPVTTVTTSAAAPPTSDADTGSEPDGSVAGSTSQSPAKESDGLCEAATVECTDWETALEWWSHDDLLRHHPNPAPYDRSEVVAIFAADGDGAQADPNAASSLLIVAYVVDREAIGSPRSILADGGIIIQIRTSQAGVQNRVREDDDLDDDGHTVQRIELNGRSAIFEEMTEQTGAAGYRLWWADDVDDETAVVVEVLADTVERETLLAFAGELTPPR